MRGSPQMLAFAGVLARNSNWRRRALGLSIAAQLRRRIAGRESFVYAVEETQALLLAGLNDPHEEVLISAIAGLGHRPCEQALRPLLALIAHPDPGVRWHLACSLGSYSQPEALAALMQLGRDTEARVRDWATFGVGTLQQVDTPEIREFLWSQLHDLDANVRGEALQGLATRQDERVAPYLVEHLNEDCGSLELEAAEQAANPLLLEPLQRIADAVAGQDLDVMWLGQLYAAIEASEAQS